MLDSLSLQAIPKKAFRNFYMKKTLRKHNSCVLMLSRIYIFPVISFL